MSAKKCPLLGITGDCYEECQEEDCAWWLPEEGRCALTSLAVNLSTTLSMTQKNLQELTNQARLAYCDGELVLVKPDQIEIRKLMETKP
ncbi:MAG: hypothetical protein GF308_11635 [Candidatus Heimdallarchaeota archaeon]|nr:hypothetical protein [Candidatus Heimdallarchaeota archaeon]